MTRRHITLESMVDTAENKGNSKRGPWEVVYTRDVPLNEELSYKPYPKAIEGYKFYHYGTLILTIDRFGNLFEGYETEYEIIYGESKSDSDAINAMLEYFGIDDVRTTFRPVNGGFIILDN